MTGSSFTFRRSRRRWSAISWWYSLIFVAAMVALASTAVANPRTSASSPKARSVSFRVTDAATGEPLSGATVSVGGQTLTSGEDGTVRVPVAPIVQDVTVHRDGYEPIYGKAGPTTGKNQTVALSPEPTPTPTPPPPAAGTEMAGDVTDGDGAPIAAALVRMGTRYVETDRTGSFSIPFDGASTSVEVSAPGYADRTVNLAPELAVPLDRFVVKGVYLIGAAAGDPVVVSEIIDLIDRTELNAVVVDTKDAYVFYDSQVPFFRDADAVNAVYDAKALVQQFHDHGIYVIARQVAFKDPLVAEAYPRLAITDEKTGKLWRGWAGEPWVNALNSELYQPNVDMAVESANLGFDEVQYDYVRFPDGDLSGADFGPNYNDPEKRIAALTTLLSMTQQALRPLGAKLSADVFGWMLLVDDDQGIGQRFPDIAAVVDYVSPMVYPSHFPEGSLAVDGHPNDFPYDTIDISISLGMKKIPGAEFKMRPWLQDFSLPGMTDYGATEIRAQIDASEDAGVSGWMVWNIDANYVDGAYKREGESQWSAPSDDGLSDA